MSIRTMKKLSSHLCALGLAASLVACAVPSTQPPGDTSLARIRTRGDLVCGIAPVVPGFASLSTEGRYEGFDIDLCRAVAAAVLGDAQRVRFVPIAHLREFAASPDIDLVVRRLSWELGREGRNGFVFGPVTFHDGQGFLVARDSPAATHGLDGHTVCLVAGEGAEAHLARFAASRGWSLHAQVHPRIEAAEAAFFAGDCSVLSADLSLLAARRSLSATPQHWVLRPERISKEPLAPLLRRADGELFMVLRWTVNALIEAEELGVGQHTWQAQLGSSDERVQQLLGQRPGNGAALGLDEAWAQRVLAAVGHYGELYARHLGPTTPIDLPRGANRLWRDGGLMWAPLLR